MARLDKNFNQINAILNAFENDATTYKPKVLQIDDYVAIGRAKIPNHTSVSGWYRIADIDNTGLASILYPQIFVMSTGSYTNYRPTEFSIVGTFPTYGSNAYARLTQLSGSVGLTYTKFRVSNDNRVYHLEVYFSSDSSSGSGVQEFFIDAIGGTLITYEPTAPISADPANVIIEHALKTTPTGAFGDSVFPTPAVVSVSSIATLKTQLTTWRTAQGSYAVGFYNVSFSAAASPFVSGARVNIEIKTASGANGVAILTTYGSSNPEMYLMRLYSGTWGDPKKVTIAS